MLIEKNMSFRDKLENKAILLTGGGGGIGFETAKALIYMGARAIIAEKDKSKLLYAEKALNSIFQKSCMEPYEID